MFKIVSTTIATTLLCTAGWGLAGSVAFAAPSASPGVTQNPDAAVVKLKPMDWVGKLYVPRFGKNYVRIIEEGTSPAVLNGVGLGHYIGTQLPGQQGNFAIAGHRAANGGPMLKIDKLKAGDKAYVKSKTGWYTYEWLATRVVKPTDVSVVYPVPPELKGAEAGSSYLTFTSCTPVHVNTYRIAAWFELVASTPLSDGPPKELGIAN